MSYLLGWQTVIEGFEHIILIFDSELDSSLLVDALLPAHMMALENKWLRCHFMLDFVCLCFCLQFQKN